MKSEPIQSARETAHSMKAEERREERRLADLCRITLSDIAERWGNQIDAAAELGESSVEIEAPAARSHRMAAGEVLDCLRKYVKERGYNWADVEESTGKTRVSWAHHFEEPSEANRLAKAFALVAASNSGLTSGALYDLAEQYEEYFTTGERPDENEGGDSSGG